MASTTIEEGGWGAPVIGGEQNFSSVSATLSNLVLTPRTPLWWYVGAGISGAFLLLFLIASIWTFTVGVGAWGVNIPVAWGLALANYTWWIGIASGGTFISSLFYIVGADWRNGVNRTAESLTLFAAAAAGMMPVLHLGRQGLFYWLFPYSTVMGVWPQFLSPLIWDFAALLCYILNSIVFWYIGLIPDCATLRDRATTRSQRLLYGILALGWRGSARDWRSYKAAYLVMAGVMAPMVVSVHSIVGLDFAAGLVAGWHSTQWPPYFFIGALYSGWAVVLCLIIPLRRLYHLERIITERHLDVIGKLMLTTGLLLAYCYLMEVMDPLYSGDPAKVTEFYASAFGHYGATYWARNTLNIFIPQLLWFPAVRRNKVALGLIALGVVTGMWLERYNFVVSALAQDYMPSEWRFYGATFWDWAILLGSAGLVMGGFFLAIRFLPIVSMFEIRELIHRRSNTEGTAGPHAPGAVERPSSAGRAL
ncbi:MAG TPA: NrfD/PsrC family molybdoenzyme membrane anchor subunit [Steroidobacteraceae bacterium]|nr:NrfD/PsrC family molybdoenzyme membrane anchor subunit [Steroidobacteraceae bacterium]